MHLPAALFVLAAAVPPPPATVAEQSGYKTTGRYQEVLTLCAAYAQAYPTRARCDVFGKSPEGRDMVALVVSDTGTLDAATAHKKGIPVLLFQGGIHAGEIDGKDAGFAFVRDALAGRVLPTALAKTVMVFVPVFNVDGHERFGPNNRPNQVGPQEMGWRTTAHNLNLNRDYAKAEAPEMQAMLRLLNAWDPILYLDLHVTDGAQFQPDIAVLVEPRLTGPEPLKAAGTALSKAVMDQLASRKHLPLPFYPAFEKDDDPASGFGVGQAPPRFSTAYWGLRNRLVALVETHSWKPYAARVQATYDTLEAFLFLTGRDGPAWLKLAQQADAQDVQRSALDVPVAFDHGPASTLLEFPGYAYTREPSAISGALRTTYDVTKPEVWHIPFYTDLVVKAEVKGPARGYYVPPAYARLVEEKLALHGFRSERVARKERLPVEVFHVTERKVKPEPYEGRQPVQVTGTWTLEPTEIAAGSLFVPVQQPGQRLLVHLMEPMAPDSLMAWGFFNAWLEQKEYMEDYVAEAEAARMLEQDPALRTAFQARLAADEVFAKDPHARLHFFYSRHPSFDARWNTSPITRR